MRVYNDTGRVREIQNPISPVRGACGGPANGTLCILYTHDEEQEVGEMSRWMRDLNDIARCATQFRSEMFQPLGIKSCHYSYIFTVCRHPGISQDQVARCIYVNKSNVARQAVILEEQGLLTREPLSGDKRVICLYPTQKAQDMIPQLKEIMRQWDQIVAADLTQEELQVLDTMLQKIKVRAGTWMEGR